MPRPELTPIRARAAELLRRHQQTLYRRTDRLFAGLMVLQWLAGIAAACWVTPHTWIGDHSRTSPNVWAALLLGGVVCAFPIALALRQPGETFTRHVIAAAQLLMSGLLIHFTGGRIETHFHVFGSLAFLACYRDWPVLVTASVVTAADHLLRGYFWPQSLYGVVSVQPWRWLEHAGWVVFTDVFLIYAIVQSRREMQDIARHRAETEAAEAALQEANDGLEARVERRTAELTAMSRHNQLLLDAAGEGIYGLDAAGLTTFINPAAARMLGYTPDELRGRPMHALLHHTHPDGAPFPREECPIYASLRDGDVHHVEDEVFWRRDGTSFPVAYITTPVREDGRVIGAVVVFRDIAERLRTEQALRASEARYRGLVDSSPEAVVVYCDSHLVYVNEAALGLFGASSADELLGRPIFDFVHPDFQALVRARAHRSQHEGKPSLLTEQRYLRLDGTAIDVEAVSTPVLWQDKPGGQVLIRDITERKRAEGQILALNRELVRSYDTTIEGWSRALDLRDHETEGHSRRVTDMTLLLARACGLDEVDLVHIRRGALLHDIGKMGVPDAVLLKPGPLTDDEFRVMQRHPTYAYEMLREVPFVLPALAIPYCHHEKWDGSGYPRGLKGEDIPLAARLFAVVDVWDALRSDRPYRRAWPVGKTRDHIAALAGSHFDPQIVQVFLREIAPAPPPGETFAAPLLRAA